MRRIFIVLLSAFISTAGMIGLSHYSQEGLGLSSRPAAESADAQSSLPPVPAGWPASNLQLGMFSGSGDAPSMRATAPFAFRYQYLSGGAGTGWAPATPSSRSAASGFGPRAITVARSR